jgi:glycogen phosphorylase
MDLRAKGYKPMEYYNSNLELKRVIDQLASGFFSPKEPSLFMCIVDDLLNYDQYMLMADYQSYVDCQEQVSQAFRDQDNWARMSILNVARMGKFSSDRTIAQYCREIWNVDPVQIELENYTQEKAGLNVQKVVSEVV